MNRENEDPSSSWLGVAGWAGFAGVAACGWLAMLLAELGCFRAWACLLFGGGIGAAVFVALARARRPARAGSAAAWAACVLAAVFLKLSLPPAEMILGGWDPGVYLHTAAGIVRHGSLRFREPDLASLSDMEKRLVARSLYGTPEPYGGMRVLPDGSVSPQFYHFYPSLMAVAYAFGGLRAALGVNPALGAGCILLLYALAARLLGRRWGLAAAVVLAANPGQLWQAGFCTAEMLTQFLLLGGLLATARAAEGGPRAAPEAVLAGVAFGAALMTRYDTLMFLAPFAGVLLAGAALRGRAGVSPAAVAVFAGLAFHAWVHQQFVAPYYKPLGPMVGACLAALAVAVAGWAVFFRTAPGKRMAAWLAGRDRLLRVGLAVGLAAFAAAAWWIRPRLETGVGIDVRIVRKLIQAAGADGLWTFLTSADSDNMLYLSALFGPVGLFLALVGVGVLIAGGGPLWRRGWLYAGSGVLAILVARVFNDHFLMWVSRRFVPVVLPLLAVGVAAALQAADRRLRGCVPARLRAVLLPGLLAGVLLARMPEAAFVSRQRDWPGLAAWYEQLVPRLPAGALVYCDQSGFAAPLRFFHGLRAYDLHYRGEDRRRQLGLLMHRKLLDGEQVVFLTDQPAKSGERLNFDLAGVFPLRSSILPGTRRAVPLKTRSRGGLFMLYRVTLRAPPAPF